MWPLFIVILLQKMYKEELTKNRHFALFEDYIYMMILKI